MERIFDFDKAERKILEDIHQCLVSIRQIASRNVASSRQGVEVLRELRQAVYEDINQIQHEEMALRAARSLQENDFSSQKLDWYWNPRQTGDASEPDLIGMKDNKIVVSAEITTSEEPKGTIDKRMSDTLAKLNAMQGERYYFVRTESMENRARTKIEKAGFKIIIRNI